MGEDGGRFLFSLSPRSDECDFNQGLDAPLTNRARRVSFDLLVYVLRLTNPVGQT